MADPTDVPYDPWWLNWILPVIGLLSSIGFVVRWVLKKVIEDDIKPLLIQMHKQNITRFEDLEKRMKTAEDARIRIEDELGRISRDLYRRGLTSDDTGNFRKPP